MTLTRGEIKVGSVRHSTGVAIGPGAQANVTFYRSLVDRLTVVLPGLHLYLNRNPTLDLARPPLAPPNPHSREPELSNLLGRNAELKQLLQLFLQTCDSKHGGVVWLTGEPGMGRKALGRYFVNLIDGLEVKPEEAEITVLTLSARFWDTANLPGEAEALYADEPRGLSAREDWAGQVRHAFPHAGHVAGPVWVSLMCGLAEALEEPSLPPGLRDDPFSLLSLLRRTIADCDAAVLLIEDYDYAGPTWDALIESLAREIARDLKLILILTARAEKPLPEYAPGALPARLELPARLVERQLATAFWLGPLTYEDFAESFPQADPGLPRALFHLAGGSPLWIEQLWADWVERDWVERDRQGIWHAAAGFQAVASGHAKDYAEYLLRRALAASSPSGGAQTFDFDDAAELLRCAALEGSTFTVQAVAAACGFDSDEVQDLFDESLCGKDGLLEEAGFVEFGLPAANLKKSVFRYRFAPPVAYHVFANFASSEEQRRLAYRLADALEKAYWPLPDRVAAALTRLFEIGGLADPDSGAVNDERNRRLAHYTRLRALDDSIEARLSEVAFLKSWAHDDASRQRLLLAQIELVERMLRSHPLKETLLIAGEALETARGVKWEEKEAEVLSLIGFIHWNIGNYPAARETYRRALAIFEKLGREDGVAVCLRGLAAVALAVGERGKACDFYRRSLALYEKLGLEHRAAPVRERLAQHYEGGE